MTKSSGAMLSTPLDTGWDTNCGTVLLVDPATISRESLGHWLKARLGTTAVLACATAAQAIGTPPRIVLLHIHSLRVDDRVVQSQIDVLRALYGKALRLAVITDRQQGELAIDAMHRNSLQGYIPTSLGSAIVAAAIRLLVAGGIFIPPELIAKQPEGPHDAAPDTRPDQTDTKLLTSREADVLRLLRLGRPNKLIAFELAITESTVKVHIRNIMRKMNATNRTQVALLGNSKYGHPATGISDALPSHLPKVDKTPIAASVMAD